MSVTAQTGHEALCHKLHERFGLTRREVEVLGFVARGMSNGQISRLLWVTDSAVKFHLTNVYRKLKVTNRVEAGELYKEVQRELGVQPDV